MSAPVLLYIIGLVLAYRAGLFVGRISPLRFAPVTTMLLVLVAVPTTLQFFHPELLPLFRRDRIAIMQGEWWRLVTALFFQDGGLWGAAFNLFSLLLVASVAEQLWKKGFVVLFFFAGGIAGELAGLTWQPIGAGNSVGSFGLAASIAVAVLTRSAVKRGKALALLAATADIALLALRDIHGAAAITGGIAALLLRSTKSAPATA